MGSVDTVISMTISERSSRRRASGLLRPCGPRTSDSGMNVAPPAVAAAASAGGQYAWKSSPPLALRSSTPCSASTSRAGLEQVPVQPDGEPLEEQRHRERKDA